MVKKRYKYSDQFSTTHFITFNCYKRRKLLDMDVPKQIVVKELASQMQRQSAKCLGFVVMPNHVHSLIHFPEPNQLKRFIQQWKRLTSYHIKRWFQNHRIEYWAKVPDEDPIWGDGYRAMAIHSEHMLLQKQSYIHDNPIRAGLVKKSTDWSCSSARWVYSGEDVGVPMGW